MDPKQELIKLKDGESWVWPESDYGKAEITLEDDYYYVYEIPLYGGKPMYSGKYHKTRIDDLIKDVEYY